MIGEWKQRVLEAVAMDDEISKLLWYNSADALSRPSLTEEQKVELVDSNSNKRRVFPTRYTKNVVMDQQSFIGMGIAGFAPQEVHYQYSDTYVIGYLYFYILVDNEIMDIDEGQRQDKLLERIYDIFSDSRHYGMGELRIGGLSELWEQNNKFGGYQLMMRVYDFK
ncbi:hypothetical protein G8B26_05005 [Limosilactobacillus reuteri]|nr:hypothetical protein G8B26_05005 [Limosilactobacillus reuteri]